MKPIESLSEHFRRINYTGGGYYQGNSEKWKVEINGYQKKGYLSKLLKKITYKTQHFIKICFKHPMATIDKMNLGIR
ncbi:hypothetical protein C7475_102796 [Chitinophaga sp. S165]|nr:hypothetical protein C7475_102796 [Chitinophaga sp. S165]